MWAAGDSECSCTSRLWLAWSFGPRINHNRQTWQVDAFFFFFRFLGDCVWTSGSTHSADIWTGHYMWGKSTVLRWHPLFLFCFFFSSSFWKRNWVRPRRPRNWKRKSIMGLQPETAFSISHIGTNRRNLPGPLNKYCQSLWWRRYSYNITVEKELSWHDMMMIFFTWLSNWTSFHQPIICFCLSLVTSLSLFFFLWGGGRRGGDRLQNFAFHQPSHWSLNISFLFAFPDGQMQVLRSQLHDKNQEISTLLSQVSSHRVRCNPLSL